MKSKKHYAYFLSGKERGVCDSWEKCRKIVFGKNARFRSFDTREEAEKWLVAGAEYEKRIPAEIKPGIYFDAGTGRGQGVEISITDENGNDLLYGVLAKKFINRFGKHLIRGKVTNNYGELLACKYALRLALKDKAGKIFGDSKLVIDYWSKGFVKKNNLSIKTIALVKEVVRLRKKFEKIGGEIIYISGGDNPADLGFHG